MTDLDTNAWSGLRVERRVEGGHRNEDWSGSAPTGRVAIRRSRRSSESLAWELELLTGLHADGFLVPMPVLTDDGRSTADGLVVQQRINGSEPTSPDDWGLVAAELERLHTRLQPTGNDQAVRSSPSSTGCRAASTPTCRHYRMTPPPKYSPSLRDRGAGCEDRTRHLMITNPIGTVRPVASRSSEPGDMRAPALEPSDRCV
jgi:hypothetical protein